MLTELVEHIEKTLHKYTREEIVRPQSLLDKVRKAHGNNQRAADFRMGRPVYLEGLHSRKKNQQSPRRHTRERNRLESKGARVCCHRAHLHFAKQSFFLLQE